MKVEILGTGCYNCLELDLAVSSVLEKLGIIDVEVVRIDDERTIRHYMPLDALPGLRINGQLVSEREVPDESTLATWLSHAWTAERTRSA